MYVVITGASRGIRLALAKIYYSKGYKLILTCEKNIDLLKKEFNEAIELPNDKINGSEKVLIKKGLLSEDELRADIPPIVSLIDCGTKDSVVGEFPKSYHEI